MLSLDVAGPSVLDGFLTAARGYPDRPAIVHNGQTHTYAELESRVLAIAQCLGSRPGVVAVPATHSPGTDRKSVV